MIPTTSFDKTSYTAFFEAKYFEDFVKKTSNFDPKKQGVLTTKGGLGRKNGNF